MRYLSLFSGVGGFELGIQRAFSVWNGSPTTPWTETSEQGVESATKSKGGNGTSPSNIGGGNSGEILCIGYSEIDKYAIQTYEKNWKGHRNYGDATAINERDLPDFELLVGGFPCQAFSVAGKRKGFDDTRGTLFFDIARILKHKRPRHLVLENVKGLLSHDSGKTLQTIAGVLSDLGYRIEWQVLNAKDFGVPQNRERIFIVGHLRGECAGQVFPIANASGASLKEVISGPQRDRVYDTEGIGPTLATASPGGNKEPKVIPTLRSTDYKNGDTQTAVAERVPLRFLNRNQRNIEGDYAFTVDASQTSGIRQDMRIRRLTPTECERLMSWPDGWTEGVSDTQRYKQCGNGVVSNCVQAVIGKMIEEECL